MTASHLPPDGCRIWIATRNGPAPDLLSAEERARADMFARPAPRTGFIRGRAILRSLLGRHLGRDPRTLMLTTGPHGKPALADGALAFSLSHAGDLLAIAIAGRGPIGIDIERLGRARDTIALARRFFHPREAALLAALPPDQRDALFVALWTVKEAVVKAAGGSLAAHLDRIEAAPASGGARFVRWHGTDEGCSGFATIPFVPAPDYRGMLAVHGAPIQPQIDHWHDTQFAAVAPFGTIV